MGRRGWSIAAVAALTTVLGTASVDAKASSFRTSGRCTHLSTAVPVDADAAQRLIGDRFVVLEPVPGTAVLALVVQDCVTAIDDGRPTAGMANVAFVFVDPVRSPAGCQTYDFFWTFSRADEWQRAMQRLGVPSGISPRSSLGFATGPVGVTARGSEPYAPAPFAITAAATDATTPSAPLPSVHCHLVPGGIARQHYDHAFRAGGGVAEYTLGASALWDDLGAAAGSSAALLARFTWTGTTEIVAVT